MTVAEFEDLMSRTGFRITRLEPHGFAGSSIRKAVGGLLTKLPVLGEWMTSYYIVECVKA
jgi:hypothetical protein